MKLKKMLMFIFLTLLAVGCSAVDEDTSGAKQSKEDLNIYTTVYPLQYIVEEIGGDTVTVHSVYPPGADGHTYEPTSKEMTDFAKSDAFIYIGEGMEGFAESVSDALESQDVRLIEIGKHQELFQHKHVDHGHDHEGDHVDNDHDEHAHADDKDEANQNKDKEQEMSLEGLADHYHTGDEIELIAEHEKDSDYDHWHWFTRESESDEWEAVEDQNENMFEGEATVPDQQIKAELYDDDHNVVAESEPVTIIIDDHEDHDPHIWTDPLRVIKAAEILKDELIELNPDEETFYNDNFEALKDELTELDQRFIDLFDTKENKHIIVPHAAFGYWEERYGVAQIPINGLSSGEEPSQKALTEVITASEKYNLDYILYEQNSKNRLSDVIQEQLDAEAVMIHNLEVRTEEDIENGKDYIDLMDDNLKVLDKITD